MDAAAVLAEQGDWEGSLSALQTAAFWQRHRFGVPPLETLAAFVCGTGEAGPDFAAMHQIAWRHLEILTEDLLRRPPSTPGRADLASV